MNYLMPFTILKKSIPTHLVNGNRRVDLSYDELTDLIKVLLRATPVDEDWYRKTYPDVAEAIAAGLCRSARHHFVESGYFEGRRPFEPDVDPAWYVSAYPDVAEGIEMGDIPSAKEHFVLHGYDEGRLPSEI